ncbi:MAG: hypothetical protein NTW94_03255 [Legionellales bacterium]|nr:hypothetical protein [Legionellales bacterium]
MKRIACSFVLFLLLTGCGVTTEAFGPQYSGYTVGYGYSGGTSGGLVGYGSYGGWASSYYTPGMNY